MNHNEHEVVNVIHSLYELCVNLLWTLWFCIHSTFTGISSNTAPQSVHA